MFDSILLLITGILAAISTYLLLDTFFVTKQRVKLIKREKAQEKKIDLVAMLERRIDQLEHTAFKYEI